MKKVGNVILVLNDKFAVIRSTEPLILGSEVLAYQQVSIDEQNKASSGIAEIKMPKGKLKVLMLQETNIYLVSVVTKKSSEETPDNQTLARSLSLYNSIFGKTQDGADASGELASYSAKLDVSKAVKVDYKQLVSPGDVVGFQAAPLPQAAK